MLKETRQENQSEAFSNPRRSDRGLSLEYVKGIKFGDAFITPQKLQADAESSKSVDKLSEEERFLLRGFCGRLPFKIMGDKSAPEPITLTAETFHFPYSIDGKKGFDDRAVRLMPEAGGKIERVELNEDQVNMHRVSEINATSEGVSIGFEFGSMRAEVKFSHQENLPPIKPRKGFKENVVLPKD